SYSFPQVSHRARITTRPHAARPRSRLSDNAWLTSASRISELGTQASESSCPYGQRERCVLHSRSAEQAFKTVARTAPRCWRACARFRRPHSSGQCGAGGGVSTTRPTLTSFVERGVREQVHGREPWSIAGDETLAKVPDEVLVGRLGLRPRDAAKA